MLKRKPFYFMRHGQTDWNKQKRWQGQTDIPLNEYGRAQARQASKHIVDHIQAIFYSPLSRAYETMLLATEHLKQQPRVSLDDLKEWHYGSLEGKIRSSAWPQAWFDAPPQGETRQEFYERVFRGLNTALSHEYEPILIVGHSATFRALCHHLNTKHYEISNAQLVYVCPSEQEGWVIQLLSSENV